MSRANDRDAALETLMLALEAELTLVSDEGRVAFLRARPHEGLRKFGDRLVCMQNFKPAADELEGAGWKNADALEGKYTLVLLLPERQKELTLADFAQGMELLADDGVLVVSLHNDWGAKRFEGHLAELAGEVEMLSKNHCRAFWARKTPSLDMDMLKEWRALGEVTRVVGDRFWSRRGLFSWDEIDDGSKLLIAHLPETIRGHVADLGAGWGFISDFLVRNRPGIKKLDVYEADQVALDCAKINLGSVPTDVTVEYHWADVTLGIGPPRFDCIVMNAPFHEGRQPDPLLGVKFIAAALGALRVGGQLWLVANRHLPYERHLAEAFAEFAIVIQEGPFKVLRAVRGEIVREDSIKGTYSKRDYYKSL
ncbi:MAG: methyltransferase [Verrucomicrobiaceae bacterium]